MRTLLIALIALIFIGTTNLSAKEKKSKKIPYFLKEYAEQYKKSPREASLAWFDQARMGLMLHWGVWGKYYAAWALYDQKMPLDQYKKDALQTDASGFNAVEIVKLAEESGMKYITFVAKHHDGFCLWDSKYTDFDSQDYPIHRDLVAELAKACRERGMPLYIYYSLGIDWTHPYFIPSELYPQARPHYKEMPDYYKYKTPKDFEIYREFCKNQLTELCTKYGPLAGFWFDPLGGVLANSEMFNVQEFYDVIHKYQPHALINYKTGATGTEDVLVGERELRSISSFYKGDSPVNVKIRNLSDRAWENNFKKKAEINVTSQGPWEWRPNVHCANADKLWEMLKQASTLNANLLLNYGPKLDGSIPEDVAVNFRKLGERIRKEGYPPLNKTTYLELRKQGVEVDKKEKDKTAR